MPAELEKYELDTSIGSGHTATVHAATVRATGEKVAVKVIKKPEKDCKLKRMLEVEKDILGRISHPNVVKVYEIFESPTSLYIVMELVEGGDLFDRIVSEGHFNEETTLRLTKELLEALHYLHTTAHVAHRDLKPENLLLATKSMDSPMKLTDFGMSKVYQTAEVQGTMSTRCGTPGYVAPEIISKMPYTEKVDLWSVGVVVYIMLCGRPPFYGENDVAVMRKITQGKYKFPKQYWSNVSDDAKSFITHLLQVNPTQRPTCAEALQHKWLTGMVPAPAARPSSPLAAFAGAVGFTTQPKNTTAAAPAAAATAVPKTAPDGRISEEGSRSSSGGEISSEASNGGAEVVPVPISHEPSVVLSEYHCSLGKRPGQAFISNKNITFVDSRTGDTKKIAIADVIDITKCEQTAYTFSLLSLSVARSAKCYGSGAVAVRTRDNAIHEFGGLHKRRDDAFSTTIRCGMKHIAYSQANQLGRI